MKLEWPARPLVNKVGLGGGGQAARPPPITPLPPGVRYRRKNKLLEANQPCGQPSTGEITPPVAHFIKKNLNNYLCKCLKKSSKIEI
jgi:hypothetical protein